jgi:hypothetical protein
VVHESWCRATPPPLHWINNRKKDKECGVAEKRIAQQIQEKLLVGVAGKTKKGPTDPEKVKD